MLSGEAAITPEPMDHVERRSRDHTDTAPPAKSNRLPAQPYCACAGRPTGHAPPK
ncbi:Hypothetical protein MIP_03243 [Mycobacterium intracellulare subsp. intracellulare MTCC 9506]|uniref:Uncharacterized protein n=1 Tax=Mycobacterium indicus pranii (strain DSM 45239 / MTCC 9506) TaxID=1232724 RepID=J9WB29_MYCIP|nr:hypothetical protein OCQ_22050 [Mycobacterium paraintracellulare]AFS14230.1 Hypothetical protein MIP_03243 [Mycobacterium intracellulare subsp. intracellulare MTCC 9506]